MKSKNIVISIIVPVYGVEKYLHKCVDSILAQTFTDFELILVDDGSQDSCPQICDEYARKDNRVKVIHKKNGGQGSARNMALDIARGQYIGFVDSDDWIEPDMYEKLYNAAMENNADISMCDYTTFDGTFQIKHTYYSSFTQFGNNELMLEYLKNNILPAPWNKLYISRIFNNIRFPEIRAREDIYIIHNILGNCQKAVHIGESKYVQLLRNNSTELQKFNLGKMALIDAMNELCRFIEIKYPQYMKYAILKPNTARISILQDIISSYKCIKYRNVYRQLIRDLNSNISQIDIHTLSDMDDYDKVIFVCKHPKFFKFKVYKEILDRKKNLFKAYFRLWLIHHHLWWEKVEEY